MRKREEAKKKFRRKGEEFFKKKKCRFCTQKAKFIDYKDINLLRRFLTPSAKILTSRASGNCAKHQRQLAQAIKRSRHLALMPFTTR